jgi:hypothetical protein
MVASPAAQAVLPEPLELTVEEIQKDYYLVGDLLYFGDSWLSIDFGGLFDKDDYFQYKAAFRHLQSLTPSLWDFKFVDQEPKNGHTFDKYEKLVDGKGEETEYYIHDLLAEHGVKASAFSTGGDGFFQDTTGRVYLVECGTFGCVHAKYLRKECIEDILEYNAKYAEHYPDHKLVHFVKLSSPEVKVVERDDGLYFRFGKGEVWLPQDDLWGFAPDYEKGQTIGWDVG